MAKTRNPDPGPLANDNAIRCLADELAGSPRRGEVFSLVFAMFGRFAPIAARHGDTGRPHLILRPHGAGLVFAPLLRPR